MSLVSVLLPADLPAVGSQAAASEPQDSLASGGGVVEAAVEWGIKLEDGGSEGNAAAAPNELDAVVAGQLESMPELLGSILRALLSLSPATATYVAVCLGVIPAILEIVQNKKFVPGLIEIAEEWAEDIKESDPAASEQEAMMEGALELHSRCQVYLAETRERLARRAIRRTEKIARRSVSTLAASAAAADDSASGQLAAHESLPASPSAGVRSTDIRPYVLQLRCFNRWIL